MINRYASLRQGLVGAWCPSLGASGFRLIDRSGYNNHGTLTNMDPGTDWVGSGGKLALDFDGVDDNVQIANAPSLQVTGPITILFWANITNNGGVSTLISKSLGSDGEFEIFADFRSGATTLAWRPGVSTNLTSFFSSFTGTWTLFSFTCDGSASGSTVTCYRNGVSAGTITTNIVRAVSSYSLAFGTRPNGINPANVRMDDVRIYNRTLTPSEINLLYTGGRGVGLLPERIKHRRKTTAATSNRRRRLICGANC
jgi:hypothetical protein